MQSHLNHHLTCNSCLKPTLQNNMLNRHKKATKHTATHKNHQTKIDITKSKRLIMLCTQNLGTVIFKFVRLILEERSNWWGRFHLMFISFILKEKRFIFWRFILKRSRWRFIRLVTEHGMVIVKLSNEENNSVLFVCSRVCLSRKKSFLCVLVQCVVCLLHGMCVLLHLIHSKIDPAPICLIRSSSKPIWMVGQTSVWTVGSGLPT